MKEEKNPCPVCQATSYEWGKLRSQGIKYFSENDSWVKKQFLMGADMKARRCLECNNVQLFTQ